MKLLLQTIVVIAGGIWLALVVREDPGYVLLGYSNYSVETSLAIFSVIALAAVFASYFIIRVLSNVFFAPRKIRKWQNQRRDRVANTALTRGLLAQAEGKWRQSEKALLTYARKTESAVNYLAAARAAQAQGANERMNQYLDMAQATDPGANGAIRLTQAELLIDSKQFDRAAAALTRIHTEDPKNTRAIALLAKVYEQSDNWEKLSELLYDIKRNKVLQYDGYNDLEKKVYLNLLKVASKAEKLLTFTNTWAIVPKHLQKDVDLVAIYAERFIQEGLHKDVEPMLRSAIKQYFNDKLVYLYGLLYTDDPYNELSSAEKWYKQNQNNATLLMTLGRLSSRSGLWGKARSYLEASVENGGGPEAYHALAQVLEHIDEPEMAANMYRKGLEIASGKGLPELAALTAKKKAKQAEIEKREAERAALEAKEAEEAAQAEEAAAEAGSDEQKVAANAA
ncbi:MAG: heme biosynthesis HemY N-terminal domain-containing protein [Gammaproteobacteria bacterium]|nr:heme biosynthesis HemY N-terminal domain-containing protein [Gammaproteobacteria bacterium]